MVVAKTSDGSMESLGEHPISGEPLARVTSLHLPLSPSTDEGWQSTTTIVRAPRFPRIERMLLAGVVLCNSTVADKREEEELDGDVTQRSQGVRNLCLRVSQ